MSATARGSDRMPFDTYPTPAWCVHRLLEACPLPGGVWLEPAAGEGAIIDAVQAHRGLPPGGFHVAVSRIGEGAIQWAGCELRPIPPHPSASVWHHGSYLEQPFEGASVIITNPPFSLALEFAQKAVGEAPHVAMLLPVNWMGGKADGRAWLRTHPPDVYRLPNRPSFAVSHRCSNTKLCGWRELVSHGSPRPAACPQCSARVVRTTSDSVEYAWLVWQDLDRYAEVLYREPRWQLLAETPKAERKITRQTITRQP